ncbi:LysR family transcriptional regulator [Asaia prunellae]|uniref:LysR family transcriptional regulator n=1 Tax=Asaia prunellae TaxID=610245 RepID=UPI0006879191|nr:LysR substrate-binding domain-containing protein [Asaia prunellae]
MIELRKLRYFLAVAEERNFSAAAKRLNMAQPPLSRQIRELEEELEVDLLDRRSRPLTLTPAGQLLCEQANQILNQHERLRTLMADFSLSQRPRLSLGIEASAFHLRLPHLIRHYRHAAPGVTLTINEMNSAEQVAALIDGRIDIGLDRAEIVEPDIRSIVLREERLVLAAPTDFSCLQSESFDLNRLTEETLILYPRDKGPNYARKTLTLLRRHGVMVPHQILVQEMTTALSLVAAKMGLCIVPVSARAIGHPEIQFLSTQQRMTCPVTLNMRAEPPSAAIALFLKSLSELYIEWGFGALTF